MCVSPGLFACGLCLCALATPSLLSALGPGQSPAGEAGERKPSSRPPANCEREYKPGRRGKRQEKEPRPPRRPRDGGSGALALGGGGGPGVCPAGWKAEGEVSSGVGAGGGGEGKRKIHRPPPSLRSVRVCAACPPRQAAPAARGAGEGTGRRRRRGGGSAQTISLPLVPGKDDFQKCELCV